MTDEDLLAEMVRRAKAAGDAAGLYLESATPLTGGGPLQLVVHLRVGDRAFLAPADVAVIEARQAEVAALEAAVGLDDAEVLRRQAEEGPLGQLERELRERGGR